MKSISLIVPLAFALSLTACGGSSNSSEPLVEDGSGTGTESPDAPEVDVPDVNLPDEGVPDITDGSDIDDPDTDDPDTDGPGIDEPDGTGGPDTTDAPDTQTELQTPYYRGDVAFSSLQKIALGPFIREAGLTDLSRSVLSRDGKSVRADIDDEAGNLKAILNVDTASGALSWLAADIGDSTQLLFDANNQPIAAFAYDCGTVSYTPLFDNSLIDLSAVIPADRCVFKKNASVCQWQGRALLQLSAKCRCSVSIGRHYSAGLRNGHGQIDKFARGHIVNRRRDVCTHVYASPYQRHYA